MTLFALAIGTTLIVVAGLLHHGALYNIGRFTQASERNSTRTIHLTFAGLLVLVEFARDEIAQRGQRCFSVLTLSLDIDDMTDPRAKHQEIHDRCGAYSLVVEGNLHIGFEEGRLANERG